MYTDIEQARRAMHDAIADTEATYGPEAVDEAYFDLVHAIGDECTEEVRAEFFRTEGVTL